MRPSVGVEAAPLVTVDDVITRMGHLAASLPPGDGVAAFHQMYLLTTVAVRHEIAGRTFADPAFLERLDVVFAGYYLDALAGARAQPRRVPACWAVLFDARGRTDLSPLQFAIAGMNAHINHDLALALVRTAEELGGPLDTGGPRHADFEAINEVLARTAPTVKARLLAGPVARVDAAAGSVDDRAALWGIAAARDFAWSTATALRAVRGTPAERGLIAAVDRMVAMTSRLLLVPGT